MNEKDLHTILESLARVIRDLETQIYIKELKVKELETENETLKEAIRNA